MPVRHSVTSDSTFSGDGAAAWDAAHLVTGPLAMIGSTTAGTDADTTMVANTSYDEDMSGWATADRVRTLPTNAAVGDEIDVYVQIGNASFELILKTGTGQTCAFAGSTIAAATEITRVFITGERMRFRYQASNEWECILDRRIPCKALMELTTQCDGEVAGTFTTPTSAGGAYTTIYDIGGIAVPASSQTKVRRAGYFRHVATAIPKDSGTAGNYYGNRLLKNGSTTVCSDTRTIAPVLLSATALCEKTLLLAVDDTMTLQYRSQDGAIGMGGFATNFIQAEEIL